MELPTPTCRPDESTRPFFSPFLTKARRFFFFGTVFVINLLATLWLADLFYRDGLHKAHLLLLTIFALLNGLLVLGSGHAIVGALDILIHGRRSVRISKLAEGMEGPLTKRFAIVMPVYNEDSHRFCARIEAIYRSLEETGRLESFDFFILSDTRDPDLWVLEETAWTNLCRRLEAFGRIYYRRRKVNLNRKAGNIGDFVRTWGGGYEAMVVLDADSLMDGGDILKMARVMEAYPRLGILQTPPRLIRGTSVFTRLQQFAMSLYGPLFIRGLNYWQLNGGSYWGHNALIRMKPFSEYCELPDLPGREPFGGKILSHDFVEAALMVTEGWEVWLAWDVKGTYEEAPPTLIDHLKRDRRWCQGNLQHLWLVFARKLPLPCRMHLLMGIMAYLGSPLWFCFLILGTWVAWDRHASGLSHLPFDETPVAKLFHVTGTQQSLYLALFVLVLLFGPKVLALIGSVLHGPTRRSFGGALPLIGGCILESLLSILLAPSVMVSHTRIVAEIVSGKSVGWGSQTRDTDGTSWGEAITVHWITTALGIGWSFIAWHIGFSYFAWMSPILLGLTLSIPVSVWTSRTRYGKALKSVNLLSSPEEVSLPNVMKLADQAHASLDPALTAENDNRYGVVAAIVDPYVNGVHVSLLEPSELNPEIEALAEQCLEKGPQAVGKKEMVDLMYNSSAMLHMHRGVWLRPESVIHPIWSKAVESYRRRLDMVDLAG